MALLVACGNAICGNSAIAAVAPVIGADSKDVVAAIAFTAVLGVLMVLGLPLFIPLAGLSEHQYGTLAGLTVYAVPQVLAEPPVRGHGSPRRQAQSTTPRARPVGAARGRRRASGGRGSADRRGTHG